jgi:hypothetical protein
MMEKSNKRGKIPQSDWPLIMARYDAGETLASIARTYDCSPPAISYVVSRSRARQPAPAAAAKPAVAPEPQLIKAVANESANGAAKPAVPPSVAEAAPPPVTEAPPAASSDRTTTRGDGDGFAAAAPRPAAPSWQPRPPTAAPANGDQRRTLHLSLGAPGHADSAARMSEPAVAEPAGASYHAAPAAGPAAPGGNGAAPAAGRDDRRHDEPPHRNGGEAHHRREGVFIDRELRARVEGDIAAFLAAFDAALDDDTPESRSALREATDRLLRAGARTRIELERLEARLPLPARDGSGRSSPAWRDR